MISVVSCVIISSPVTLTCFSAQPCQVVVLSVNDPNFLWTYDNYKIITDYVLFVQSTYIFYHSNQPNGKKSACSGSEWWLLVVNICANFRKTVMLTTDLYYCIFQCSLCIITMLLIDWLIVVLYTGTSVTWGRLEISVCYLNSRRETQSQISEILD